MSWDWEQPEAWVHRGIDLLKRNDFLGSNRQKRGRGSWATWESPRSRPGVPSRQVAKLLRGFMLVAGIGPRAEVYGEMVVHHDPERPDREPEQ